MQLGAYMARSKLFPLGLPRDMMKSQNMRIMLRFLDSHYLGFPEFPHLQETIKIDQK